MHSVCIQKNGIPLPAIIEIKKTIGLSLEETFKKLTNKNIPELLEKLRMSFLEASKKDMVRMVRVFDQTIETLSTLKELGLKVGIVSGKDSEMIESIAKEYGFLKYIDLIVGENDVVLQKPEPESIIKAITFFDVRKEEVLFVGDSLIDCCTAQNAKVDFCAITSGVTGKDVFWGHQFVGILSNLDELIQLI